MEKNYPMKHKKCPPIGGQAVIEGVMMRSPWKISIAVRRPGGAIITDVKEQPLLITKNKLLGLPVIRGVINLVDSLLVGMRALTYSATMAMEEEEEKLSAADMSLAILLAFGLFVGLFIALPTFLTSLVDQRLPTVFTYNLAEGGFRVGIFILYLTIMSFLKDFRRIFEYHGAEHKTIYAFENGEEITLNNVEKYTTAHPRCGTNWLVIVMVVSIFIFSFLGRPGFVTRVVSRIVVIPLVAGVAYEIIKLLSRNQHSFIGRVLAAPGLLLQKITTKEPDTEQLEVAFQALKGSMQGDRTDVER